MCTSLKSHSGLRRQAKASRLWSLSVALTLLIGSPVWAQVPPVEGRWLFGRSQTGVDATTDIVLDFRLTQGSLLRGKVAEPNGSELMSGSVFAQSMAAGFSGRIGFWGDPMRPTEGGFEYRMAVLDETYSLSFETRILDAESAPPTNLSLRHDLQETVTVVGHTVWDITVPVAPMLYTVSGAVMAWTTIPSTGRLLFLRVDGTALSRTESNAVGDHGSYGTRLPAGEYDMLYFPNLLGLGLPSSPTEIFGSLWFRVATITVSADLTFDIVLPEPVTLSGTITDDMGMPLASASVSASASEELSVAPPEPVVPTAVCQPVSIRPSIRLIAGGRGGIPRDHTDGMYRLSLVPETYNLHAFTTVELQRPAPVAGDIPEVERGSLTFPLPLRELAIVTDQVQDVIVPKPQQVVEVSGTVVDDLGIPVANAWVIASSGILTETPTVGFSNHTQTGFDGTYHLLVYSGIEYTVLVCPQNPSGIGMSSASVNLSLSPQVQEMMTRPGSHR